MTFEIYTVAQLVQKEFDIKPHEEIVDKPRRGMNKFQH